MRIYVVAFFVMRNLVSAVALTIVASAGLVLSTGSDTGAASAATTPSLTTTKTITTSSARSRAFDHAYTQKGKPYRYGGKGPNSYDCSGLVYWAYHKAGLNGMPRVVPDQKSYAARHGHRVSRSSAQTGDLVFWGGGHVEFAMRVNGKLYRFGAHHSGTRISRENMYGSPTIYRVTAGG